MSRAKPISCVAISMVMPPAASSLITSSTSATSSGSSALVTSSSSMICGFMASARTIATRCCCPPDSRSGKSASLSARPNRPSSALASSSAAGARGVRHLHRGQRHVPQHGHVREQVEGLEHDPDVPAHQVRVDVRPGDLLAPQADPPGVDRLEQVHAAQQRGLAGAGRPDQADHLVRGHGQVDALEHLVGAERLAQPLDPDRLSRPGGRSALALMRRLRRGGGGGPARSAGR